MTMPPDDERDSDDKDLDDKEAPAKKKLSADMSRLEAIAKAAEASSAARRWQARRSGFSGQGEAAEVRNVTQNEEAKAQAEAAMKRLLEKKGTSSKRRR